jgi:hypothetical protein
MIDTIAISVLLIWSIGGAAFLAWAWPKPTRRKFRRRMD